MSTPAFALVVVGAPIAVVLGGLAAVAHRVSAEPDARGAVVLAQWLAVASVLVVLVLVGVWAVDRRRRRRARTVIDPVTRLPSGTELDRWTGSMLATDAYHHHAVAVVRVNELEMVRTVFGEAMRDRVVVDVANRLRAGVDWLTGARADATATLLATGPDEFVVSLHAATSIDLDLVQRVLTLRSGRILLFGGDRVPVSWTVGFGSVRSGADVEGIVAEARTESYLTHPVARAVPAMRETPLSFQRAA